MTVLEIVSAILKWAVLLAEKFGHSSDDLRAEIERQLKADLPSSAAWDEYLRHLP
jgi:hypothetical protein